MTRRLDVTMWLLVFVNLVMGAILVGSLNPWAVFVGALVILGTMGAMCEWRARAEDRRAARGRGHVAQSSHLRVLREHPYDWEEER